MATLADPTWVEYWLELGDVHVLDPRPSLDYNRGHLPGAVSVPLERLLDERGALLHDEALGAVFGKAGVDESKRSLVYDGADGRRGALMAWTLEYLGRGEVSLSALLFEGWAQQGYPVSAQPETPTACEFNLNVNPNKRASLQELEIPQSPQAPRSAQPGGVQRLRRPTARRIQPAVDRVSWQRPPALASRLRTGAPSQQSGHRTHGQGGHLLHHRRAGRHRLPGPQTRRLRRSRPTQPSLAHPPPPYAIPPPPPVFPRRRESIFHPSTHFRHPTPVRRGAAEPRNLVPSRTPCSPPPPVIPAKSLPP